MTVRYLCACRPLENFLIHAAGFGQGLRAKFAGQNLPTVTILGQCQIGAALLDQVLHQQTMETLAAGIKYEGFAIDLDYVGVLT